MTEEGVFERGDEYISPEGERFIALPAATDGSGCYVCDDGIQRCAFFDTGKCPKCHSSNYGWIDYMGERVIFVRA